MLQLSERGQARLDQIQEATGRVQEFYRLVDELQGLLGKAEENLNAQGMVGSEVEMIKQQLQEFKVGWRSCGVRRGRGSTVVTVCVEKWREFEVEQNSRALSFHVGRSPGFQMIPGPESWFSLWTFFHFLNLQKTSCHVSVFFKELFEHAVKLPLEFSCGACLRR